jgi:hypothetical protein
MTRQTLTLLTACAAGALISGCASMVPVVELTAQQANQLPGFTEIPLAQANFRTAALVNVTGKSGPGAQDVARQTGGTAAAYAGVELTSNMPPSPTPGPVTAGPPASGSLFAFKQSGDAGQGWATATGAGMPFVQVQALGLASASGTAAWQAQVTTTPGHENVYVQFRLPKADLTGFTEQNGPSDWQSRIRGEFSVNGHPFWLTEATRVSQLAPGGQGGGGNNCGNGFQGTNKVLAYGTGVGFSDASTTSTAKVVTLWLGAFPDGQTVSFAFNVRADALVKRQCCPKNAMGLPEFFCTRATADVTWDNAALPVRIWTGPPVS